MKSLYIIRKENSNHYKIGISENPSTRLKQLQTSNSETLELINVYKTKFAFKLESALHRALSSKSLNGEWFLLERDDLIDLEKKIPLMEFNFSYIREHSTLNF